MGKAVTGRAQRGQGIIELVIGMSVLLVPLSLALLDVGTVMACVQTNQALARNACKQAARALPKVMTSTPDGQQFSNGGRMPSEVATEFINRFKTNSVITGAHLSYLCEKAPFFYELKHGSPAAPPGAHGGDPAVGHVVVITAVDVELPVPIPGCEKITLFAEHTEPVTSVLWTPHESTVGHGIDGP
jgi:hypothetical protein